MTTITNDNYTDSAEIPALVVVVVIVMMIMLVMMTTMMLVMMRVVLMAKMMVVVQLAPSYRGWSPKAAAVPFEKRRSPSGD